MGDFGDVTTALRMRDVIAKMVKDTVNSFRPPDRFGRVLDVNRFAGAATILLNGDSDPVNVRMNSSIQPMYSDANAGAGNGSMVRVGGNAGNYWILQILSGQSQTVKQGLASPRLIGGPLLANQTASYDTVGPVALQAIGNTTHFGRWDNTNSFGGAGIAHLEIVLKWTFFTGNIKKYEVPLRNSATAGAWQKLAPLFDSGDNSGNDFELEIMADGNGFELRARRMGYFGGGLTPGGMSIDVWTHGDAYDYVAGSALGEEASTVPTRFFGTDATSFMKGPFLSPGMNFAFAAQDMLTGGGDLQWNGTNITWTQVIHISGLSRNQYLPFGFIDIGSPAAGVTVPVYGVTAVPTTRTTVAGGIALGTGEFLYVEPPWGDTAVSLTDATFLRIVGRIVTDRYFTVPSHWVCIGYVEQVAGIAKFFSFVRQPQGSSPWAQAAGSVNISLSAVAFNTAAVTFPTNRFTQTPRITAQLVSPAGSAIKGTVLIFSQTTTGCTIRLDIPAATTGTFEVDWHAIQMFQDSASG